MRSNGAGAHIESSMPGRVRIRVPHKERREHIFSNIKDVLCEIEGITNITSNLTTGSMLIESDPDELDVDKIKETLHAANLLASVGQQIEEIVEEEHWPGFSHMAHTALCRFKKWDRKIKRHTGGMIDGKMLIVLLILALGISRALVVGRKTPAPWHALLWYAYSIFMHWHDPHRVVNG